MKRHMTDSRHVLCAYLVFLALSSPALASVKYKFVTTEQPAGDFFKPMVAEIVLSDAAVTAGTASKGQIEALVVKSGTAMQEANQITLTYLHNDFIDLAITLSADRSTISSISAWVSSSGAPIDYWVFHYQRPVHPSLDIHEFVGYIRPDSVTLETTILPVPPTTHVDTFVGHWQRVRSCWLCRYSYFPIGKWQFCWLDWFLVSLGVIIVVGYVIRRRRKYSGSA